MLIECYLLVVMKVEILLDLYYKSYYRGDIFVKSTSISI